MQSLPTLPHPVDLRQRTHHFTYLFKTDALRAENQSTPILKAWMSYCAVGWTEVLQ